MLCWTKSHNVIALARYINLLLKCIQLLQNSQQQCTKIVDDRTEPDLPNLSNQFGFGSENHLECGQFSADDRSKIYQNNISMILNYYFLEEF